MIPPQPLPSFIVVVIGPRLCCYSRCAGRRKLGRYVTLVADGTHESDREGDTATGATGVRARRVCVCVCVSHGARLAPFDPSVHDS